MTWKDPILEEVNRIRDELAKQLDYYVNRIFEHFRKLQAENEAKGQLYVSFPPKRPSKKKDAA